MALVRSVRSVHARLGIVAGILAAVLALGYAALHSSPARRLALGLVLHRLERSGIVARADGLDYNLATLRFHLSNVTLSTPSASSMGVEPFFTARDVRVRLAPATLIGRIVLKDVVIDEPRVALIRTSDGTTNWPGGASEPSGSSSLPDIRIEHARVTELGVRWRDSEASVDVSVSFELATNGKKTSGRIVATRPGRIDWKGHQTTVQALDGRLSWNGSDVGLGELILHLPEGTVTADGRIEEVIADPRLDMRVVAETDLSALAPWLETDRAIRGTSRAEVKLAGPLQRPEASFSLAGHKVAVAGVPTMDFDAAGRVTEQGAEITDLRARLAGGLVSASGRTTFDGRGTMRAEWHGVDLAAVVRDVWKDSPPRTRVIPSAILSGTLDAGWTAPGLETLQLSADARAARDTAGAPRSMPVDGSVKFAVRARRWQLSTEDIGTEGARASGSVSGSVDLRSLARSTIAGSIHVSAEDARRVADTLVLAGLVKTAPDIRGNATGDFTVSGLVSAPSFDGPLRATIGYESLPPAELQARASIAPGAASLHQIDVRLGESSAQGEVEWSSGSDLLRGTIGASVAMADLSGLSATASDRLPLDGRLGVSAALSGTLVHPRATVTANSTGLDVAGQHFDLSTLDVSADLAAFRFVVDRLTLQSGGGRIDGRGDIDLTRGTYAAHLTASDVPVSPLIGIGDSDVPISARLNGSFDGEGSFTNLGGHGRVSLAEVRWKEAEFGNITAEVTLEGRNASVSAEAPELALEISGSIGVDPRGVVAVRGDWAPLDVAPISERLGVTTPAPVTGSANVRFELTGTRDRLDELRGVARLNALDIMVGGQALRLSRPGQIEYDGRTARAGNIALTAGMSTLVIDGSIGNGSIAGGSIGDQAVRGLTVSLDGSLADFAFVRDLVQPHSSGTAPLPSPTGSVQLRVAANGSLSRPIVTGTLQIVDGRVPVSADQSVTGIGLRASLDAGVLTVESAAAAFEGASLEASARVPGNVIADRVPPFLSQRMTPAGGPATLSARLRSVTPAVASPFVDAQTLAELSGHVDATVQLETDRFALDRVRGTVTLDRLDLALGGIPFDQQVATRVVLQDRRLTVEAWDWGRGDNRLVVRGGASLGADGSLDLVATSVLDLRVLNIFAPSARIGGLADAEIRVGGSVRVPTLDGWVTFSNGEARVANPRLVISDVTGTITLAADTVTFERIFASVNGGNSEISGTLHHRWFLPLGGRITMLTNGAALAIEGLRAEANINVGLDAEPGRPVISGTITLVRSAYRERLSLTSGLLRAIRAPTGTPLPAAPSPLDRLRLDVRIVTQSDLLVDNNYGKLSASADLRLVGTATRPSLTGRTTLGEGGTIFFGTRRYRLQEGGSIDFANPNRIEPDLNITAVTNVQNTEITLALTGTPGALDTRLTSDNPEYTQSDLVSLLLTGQTASNATSAGVEANGAQLLGLLSGEFLGAAGQAVGLTTLRIASNSPDERFDAGLVAGETDPGARLTIGRNIGSRFEVVFSQSLQQSGDLTWIVSYAPKSNLSLRVVNLDDGDRVYDFRHDLTFGRPASATRPAPRPRETVVSLQLTGAGIDEAALLSLLTLHQGDRFNFFRWQDDRERIERYYHDRDRFEARVVTRRTVDAADSRRVSLIYDVSPGPRTTMRSSGFMLSSSTIREIERAWTGTVVDDLLEDEVVKIARGVLADAGYVQASITTRMQRTSDEKQLTILIETGTHASNREVRFAGNRGESAKRLSAVLAEPGLARAVWIEPDVARDALVAFYRANGYLNVAVRIDPIASEDGTVIRPIRVDEGEPFLVRDVRVEGARSLSPAEIIGKAGLSRGEVLTEFKMEQARVALDQGYRALGFNSVALTLQSVSSPDTPVADLSVRVDEGRQQRLRDIVTTGVEHTRPSLVSRALRLNLGQPVDLSAWNEARRRLYETGAFRSVDIEREVIAEPSSEPAAPTTAPAEPVRALVTVQEWPRFRFRYGIELNDTAQSSSADPSDILPTFQEGGRAFSLGATTDFAARNLLGRAVTAGAAARYTLDFRAARTYATMPTFLGRRITSTVWLEQSHEDSGTTATGIHPAFTTDATTLTFEQRIRPLRKVEVQYGYSLERNHTFELHPVPADPLPFDITVTKANLTSGIVMDMRDDGFDATRGWFHSSNVEYAPDWLSPDLRLARLLTQQRYYRRVGKVVFASWARVGLGTGFDQTLLENDRFFAGGGNSVRGYAEDALSPTDFFGTIVGGNALIVLNQEVRFPLFKYVRGVGFIDAGRAFETVGQMSLRDLAAGTGIGFRVQTPVVLLRFDMGVPLNESAGSRRPRWFFSIGQMF